MVFCAVVFGVSDKFEICKKLLFQQENSTIIRYLDAEVLCASENCHGIFVAVILKDEFATQIVVVQALLQNRSLLQQFV